MLAGYYTKKISINFHLLLILLKIQNRKLCYSGQLKIEGKEAKIGVKRGNNFPQDYKTQEMLLSLTTALPSPLYSPVPSSTPLSHTIK